MHLLESTKLNKLISQNGTLNYSWDENKTHGLADGFSGSMKFFGKNSTNSDQGETQLLSFANKVITKIHVSQNSNNRNDNIACGGPRSVVSNNGCPVDYTCSDLVTMGGETSGRCIKN